MRRFVCWILGHREEVVAHTAYEVEEGRHHVATFFKSPILQCLRCRRIRVMPKQHVYLRPWSSEDERR